MALLQGRAGQALFTRPRLVFYYTVFARTVVTKSQIGGLTYIKVIFSHSSRDWKSEMKVLLAGFVSSEASRLGLWMAFCSLCRHMVLPLYMSVS